MTGTGKVIRTEILTERGRFYTQSSSRYLGFATVFEA